MSHPHRNLSICSVPESLGGFPSGPAAYHAHPMESILDAIFPIGPQFSLVIVAVIVIHLVLATVGILVYFERKISAYIQDRIGPNRVGFDLGLPLLQKLFRGFGFWGLGQSLADGLKFILKDYRPPQTDKILQPRARCFRSFRRYRLGRDPWAA